MVPGFIELLPGRDPCTTEGKCGMGRQLYRNNVVLMDTKLAGEISPEEYATKRNRLKRDMAECSRRRNILVNEIRRHQQVISLR